MLMPASVQTSKHNGGYALLEILLAFAVAIVIIVGLIFLGASSVKAVTVNRASAEAGKIAQREVERLKLLRDTSTWTDFTNAVNSCSSPTNCYLSVVNGGVTVNSPAQGSEGVGSNSTVYYFNILSGKPADQIWYIVRTESTVGTYVKTYKIEGVLTKWKEL